VRTANGPRFCPVVLSANGRIKPDFVVVNRHAEYHPEGFYYLEWRVNGKRLRLSVGQNAQDAATRRHRKEAELNALNHGVDVLVEGREKRRTLKTCVHEYLEELRLVGKKSKTHSLVISGSLATASMRLRIFVPSAEIVCPASTI